MKTNKLLITGVSGFLGWNLAQIAIEEWQVHGLYNKHSINLQNVDAHQCDLMDLPALEQITQAIRPDAIIHLAAVSSPNVCQDNAVLSRTINIKASEAIACIANSFRIPLVFTSSSQVYSGNDAPYNERSLTQPVNDYGVQKLSAEVKIRQLCPHATICRVPLMYGAAPEGATSSLQPVLAALRSGSPMKLFTDEIRNSLGAVSASRGLLHALSQPGELFILAGDKAMSRYDFACRAADFFGYEATPLIPITQSDLIMSAKRPSNLTMDNSKIKRSGFSPLSLEEEFDIARALGA